MRGGRGSSLKIPRPSGWRARGGAAPPGGSLSSWGCGQRRGRPTPETGTTHWASGPSAAPPHSWHPPHPTSPRHLTDWNDSGSVLKFLGTHKRHGERLRAPASPPPRTPPRPHRRRARRSLEPTPRAARRSRKCRVNGSSLTRRPRPWRIPAPRALTPRASKAPSVAPMPLGSLPVHPFWKTL